MSGALKWKLIAGFALVFLAGGATGVFVSATAARHFFFGPHRHGFAAQAMRNRLRAQLSLTDEQLTKITPIVEKAGSKLEDIRSDTGRRVRETFAEAHREISPILTPEQRQRLQQIEARHRRWMHRSHGSHDEATAAPETASPPE
jgi:Spy/CpxP family protein refolding chaperone